MDNIELLIQMIQNGNLGSNVVSNVAMRDYLEFMCSGEQADTRKYGQPYISYFDVDTFSSFITSLDTEAWNWIINGVKQDRILFFINNLKLIPNRNNDVIEIKDVLGTKYFSLETDAETGDVQVTTFEACDKSLKFEAIDFPSHAM